MSETTSAQNSERLARYSAWTVIGFLILVGLGLWRLCFLMGPSTEDHVLNETILVSSVIFGWLAGMLLSPASTLEEKKFGVAAKAVSTFVSGYLLAKIDPIVSTMLNPKTLLEAPTLLPAFRVTLVLAAVTGAFFHIYVLRVYIIKVKAAVVTGADKAQGETSDSSPAGSGR